MFRADEYGSSAHPCNRDNAVLAGKSRPNGVGYAGDFGQESGKTVVVDRNDGDGRMRLFRRHTLVSGYEGRETFAFRPGQEFVVAERAPVVEIGGFDHDTAELLPQARRHADIKQNLHAQASRGGIAVGIAGRGSTDGRRSDTQDGGSRPAIDLKIAQELIQGDAVLNPVEELLDGEARTAETGHTAHACGIDPYGFCKLHGRIRASDRCLHAHSGVCDRTNTEEDTLGGGGVQ